MFKGVKAAAQLSDVRRGDHTPAATDADGDDERFSTAAWLLAADHVRPRRCRQLPQPHPAAARSTQVGVSVPTSRRCRISNWGGGSGRITA